MRVLVVVPAYNEEQALGGVLAELGALKLDGTEIQTVVVDDGSRDRTHEVAAAGGVRVLRLSHNLGIGGAVQAGLRLANREKFDCAVQLDGDGQHPPSEIAKLLEAKADLVIGTRYLDRGGFRSTLLRRLGSGWLRFVLRAIARVKSSDPTSGFRVYGPRALALFDETYPYDYPEPESLAIARARGLSIAEVRVAMRERQGGQSSIGGLYTIYYMVKVTLAIALAYLRARRKHG